MLLLGTSKIFFLRLIFLNVNLYQLFIRNRIDNRTNFSNNTKNDKLFFIMEFLVKKSANKFKILNSCHPVIIIFNILQLLSHIAPNFFVNAISKSSMYFFQKINPTKNNCKLWKHLTEFRVTNSLVNNLQSSPCTSKFNAHFVNVELLFSRQHKYFSFSSYVKISVTSFRIISKKRQVYSV